MASSSSSSRSRSSASELSADQLSELFSHLTNEHRGAAAVVSRGWCKVERNSRFNLTINNCYASDPMKAVTEFPNIKFLTVKGMPRFADFGAFPPNWGADAVPWINAARTGWRNLKEITLKRMSVTNRCLELIAIGLEHLEVLRLILCDGFSSVGLAHIAAKHGRHLRTLELEHRNNQMKIPTSWLTYPETPTTFSGTGGVQMIDWISYFPTSYPTVLQTINISCLISTEHNFDALERLVNRSPQLKKLMLCDGIPLDKVARIVRQAPNLMELGIGKINNEYTPSHVGMLRGAIAGCNNLVSLHGSSSPVQEHHYIEAFHCVCGRLTYINLYGANPPVPKFKEFIMKCGNLQKLWVMDLIRDDGLAVVASSCRKLQELRVFPYYPDGPFWATQIGLLHVSNNCPDLTYILYWCYNMTNEALKKIAAAHPSLTCFRLGIHNPKERDYNTGESFDEGFGAIVRYCKRLERLSLGGYLTDRVFKYIGDHAKSLYMFSTAFAGTTEQGLDDVLRGCKSLRKMDVKGCPFGNKALLRNTEKLKTMRSFFLSGCPPLTVGGCKELAKNIPGFAFEILMNYDWRTCPPGDECQVERLFVYPTISNQRPDAPNCVRSFWYPVPK